MDKRTHIAILLDSSGSMADICQAAIDGYNEQGSTIQASGDRAGATFVSLYTFGGDPESVGGVKPKVECVFSNESPLRMTKLDRSTYKPYGCTPMYDAVGQAIETLSSQDQSGDVGFLVVVISDGRENASIHWTQEQIASKVAALQATGKWTFAYIGANQDLASVTKLLGLHSGNTMKYVASVAGTGRMTRGLGKSFSGYLSMREQGLTNSVGFVAPEETP